MLEITELVVEEEVEIVEVKDQHRVDVSFQLKRQMDEKSYIPPQDDEERRIVELGVGVPETVGDPHHQGLLYMCLE